MLSTRGKRKSKQNFVMGNELLGIKRKCENDGESVELKRQCWSSEVHLLNFSDCTLLKILKFLDTTSLYHLGLTCTRFKYLVEDESLWVHVDARAMPNPADKIEYSWNNVNKKTTRLLLAANQRSELIIYRNSLNRMRKLTNLRVLALEHQCIKYCKLNDFPQTLEEISFRKSYMPQPTTFFQFCEKEMRKLKTLILDHCQWLEANIFTSLCRLPCLEILSLYMCKKLMDDDIASVSLAAMFGFKTLKVVDLRFTGIGDLFLRNFYANLSIQIIYFQSLTSYYMDRYKRKLDILEGNKIIENSYVSDDEENNDTCRQSLQKRFNTTHLEAYNVQTVKDDTLRVFLRLKKNISNNERPPSDLYKYPYQPCTCGFMYKIDDSRKTPSNNEGDSSSTEDDQKLSKSPERATTNYSNNSIHHQNATWDKKEIEHKLKIELMKQKHNCPHNENSIYFIVPRIDLCSKIQYDSCMLPDWYNAQSTPKTRFQRWLYLRKPRNDYEISMFEHADKHLRAKVKYCCNCTTSMCEYEGMILYSNHFIQDNAEGLPVDNSDCYSIKVASLIQQLTNLLQEVTKCDLDETANPNKILIAINNSLRKPTNPSLETDLSFITELNYLFSQLSNAIRQDVQSILFEHLACFKDLLRRLTTGTAFEQKVLIIRFFRNILHSVNHIPDTKLDESHITSDDLDIAGPSSLQFAKFCLHTPKTAKRFVTTLTDDCCEIKENEFNSGLLKYENRVEYSVHSLFRTGRRGGRFITEQLMEEHHLNAPQIGNIAIEVAPLVPNRETTSNIHELSFRGFINITDKGLELLKEMDLSVLDVTGTSVTEQGLQNFIMYNPHCRVLHEKACICQPILHF